MKYLWYLLNALPGLVFAAAYDSDFFGRLAVFAIAFIFSICAAVIVGIYAAFGSKTSEIKAGEDSAVIEGHIPEKNMDLEESIKTDRQVLGGFWVILLIVALLFGGTSYVGVAVWGTIVGNVDQRLRPDKYVETVEHILSPSKDDKKKNDQE